MWEEIGKLNAPMQRMIRYLASSWGSSLLLFILPDIRIIKMMLGGKYPKMSALYGTSSQIANFLLGILVVVWALSNNDDDDDDKELLNFILYKFRHVPVYGYGLGTMTAGGLILAGLIEEDAKRGKMMIEKGTKAFFPGVRAGYNIIKDLTDGK